MAGNGKTYTWDAAGRLTAASVGGTTTTYSYDGDGTRASKTSGGATTSYLWDRQSGLPLLVDDGTHAYVQQDGALATIDSTGAARYPVTDALGSLRGESDGSGTLSGLTDYDVFGAVRAGGGTTGALGYTGEQGDGETGLTYLRARYTDPATGRFLSADSVQPNAPGTQGYHRYSYTANNPTTWTDPSGHTAVGGPVTTRPPVPGPVGTGRGTFPQRVLNLEIRVAQTLPPYVLGACLAHLECGVPFIAGARITYQSQSGVNQWGGLTLATFALISCLLDIEIVNRPGPRGLQNGGGDHCFQVYTGQGEVQDCFGKPALLCTPTPPQGTKTPKPGCQYQGVEPPPDEERVRKHVIPEHHPPAPGEQPRPTSKRKPTDPRWNTYDAKKVSQWIEEAARAAHGLGHTWKPDGADGCVLYGRASDFIGWEDHPTRNPNPTKCMRIVIKNTPSGPLLTARPAPDRLCVTNG